MKNIFSKTILGASLVVALNSCSKFGDKYLNNPNPQVNTVANTSQLLTNLLYKSCGRGNAGAVNGDLITLGAKEPALFVQYIAEAIYPSEGLYASTSGEWATFYSGPLMDLAFIINYNTDADLKGVAAANGSNNNQIATARIWRAYLMSILTDRWGNVPYSQANKVGLVNPAYDNQKDIYTDLFKELREAVDQFDNGAAFKGDILFNGDQTKWKKFANSLRMVLAMRLSKVDAVTGKAEYLSASTHAAGYITTNADNAVFAYQDNLNFRNPWNNQAVESNAFGVSDFFVNLLKSYNDPRLNVYATQSTTGNYKGVPYGLNAGNLATALAAAGPYSKMGTTFTARNSPGYFITAAQVLLTRAEAGLRGWVTTTNIKADYDAAVTASLALNGISATAATTYLATTNVLLNPTNVSDGLNKVAIQKYIALYPNGVEAFAEWRRTGLPALTPAVDALNASKQIPRRWGYPTTEATLNTAAYLSGIASMGGDNSIDRRVYWDKQ